MALETIEARTRYIPPLLNSKRCSITGLRQPELMIDSKVVGCANQSTYIGLIDSGGFVHDEITTWIQKTRVAFAI